MRFISDIFAIFPYKYEIETEKPIQIPAITENNNDKNQASTCEKAIVTFVNVNFKWQNSFY